MYLDNPKKLFKDLKNIDTMRCYMVACEEDGESENLSNLFSIVGCNRGELHEGGEGSERWNLENYETEKDRQQVIKDSRTIDWIYKVIQKELKAKYVMECSNCGTCYFYLKKPKYSVIDQESDGGSHYICGKCKKENTLNVYTMESWLAYKGIDLKEVTRYM